MPRMRRHVGRKRKRRGNASTSRLGPLTKRRFLKRRQVRRRNALILPKGVTPRSMRVRLKMFYPTTIVSTLGNVASTPIVANSIYRPFGAAIVDTFRGNTDLFNWYQHATVNFAKISVHAARDGNTPPAIIGVRTSGSDTEYTDLVNNCESARSKWQMTGYNSDSRVLVTQMVNLNTFYNKRVAGESEFRHTAIAYPTELAHFIVFVGPADKTSSVTYDVAIQLTYDVTFTEPKVVDN